MKSVTSDTMKKSFQSISRVKSETNVTNNLNNEICSVCAESEPKFWSISGCGHKICWICSLRLRSLYASKSCPICKTQNNFIFICKRAEDGADFEKKLKSFPQNLTLSIVYENEVVRTTCENLLQLQCPFNHGMSMSATSGPAITKSSQPCTKHFKTKHELRKHVQNAHELLMCEICLEHKKCFSVELPLYNRSSLQKHQREVNHPRCAVCDRIFYSEDELNEHCRDAHELCHICQRTGRPGRYFLNYSRLEEHFGKEHFLCPEPLCKELKFVVFESELEYKAHQAEVHLSHQKLQRSQQRQLQRLNINFGGASQPVSSTTGNPSASQLKLTQDQRNQIAANLVYGEVNDDLANRLQSLSLYQNRNDEFIESLRGTFHLNRNQVQAIFDAARAFQRGDSSATDLLLKVEKVLDTSKQGDLIKIAEALADLQLDEVKKQRLNFAISQYHEKCAAFPELGGVKKTPVAQTSRVAPTWAAGRASKKMLEDEDEKSTDPFAFARASKPPGYGSPRNISSPSIPTDRSVKVLQILKPSTPTAPPKTADPSRNPGLLLSQLAGGPGPRKKSSTATPVKMTTFSSAALGSVSATSQVGKKQQSTKLNEQEFPSLTVPTTTINSTSTSSPNIKTQTTSNAFFAPSDRDQLDSFTIGSEGEDREEAGEDQKNTEQQQQQQQKTGKKTKKLVFKYGQKWNV